MTDAAMMYEQRYQLCREQGQIGWFSGKTLENILSRLSERIRAEYLPSTGSVLELGCGAADQALMLAEAGYQVAGVDIAPTSILWANEKAKQRGLDADFRVGNVCGLEGFADASFDLVLDGNCLHFVIGGDRKRLLESAYRVLKPGGWLIITTICGEPNSASTVADFDSATRCYITKGVAYTYQGIAQDIRDEIAKAGFEIQWQEITPGIPDVQSDFLRLDARKP